MVHLLDPQLVAEETTEDNQTQFNVQSKELQREHLVTPRYKQGQCSMSRNSRTVQSSYNKNSYLDTFQKGEIYLNPTMSVAWSPDLVTLSFDVFHAFEHMHHRSLVHHVTMMHLYLPLIWVQMSMILYTNVLTWMLTIEGGTSRPHHAFSDTATWEILSHIQHG